MPTWNFRFNRALAGTNSPSLLNGRRQFLSGAPAELEQKGWQRLPRVIPTAVAILYSPITNWLTLDGSAMPLLILLHLSFVSADHRELF